eukprot:CAMPEP_0204582998 /NCGR_PEP_ID=MMETSP0661-20131031/45527_1 /ASSEMBLY_ACC=CAM_ASM_000606 /TAXON_ID=109239 /ORGANISM="Alexandrium margalefi, Strain AMGDE01CS-322" /LENGTH=390 /DNA_ID=CAMNT_0051592321 /DNA_START=42 /DNA_END=1210 /DNA_ORIENTATION=+
MAPTGSQVEDQPATYVQVPEEPPQPSDHRARILVEAPQRPRLLLHPRTVIGVEDGICRAPTDRPALPVDVRGKAVVLHEARVHHVRRHVADRQGLPRLLLQNRPMEQGAVEDDHVARGQIPPGHSVAIALQAVHASLELHRALHVPPAAVPLVGHVAALEQLEPVRQVRERQVDGRHGLDEVARLVQVADELVGVLVCALVPGVAVHIVVPRLLSQGPGPLGFAGPRFQLEIPDGDLRHVQRRCRELRHRAVLDEGVEDVVNPPVVRRGGLHVTEHVAEVLCDVPVGKQALDEDRAVSPESLALACAQPPPRRGAQGRHKPVGGRDDPVLDHRLGQPGRIRVRAQPLDIRAQPHRGNTSNNGTGPSATPPRQEAHGTSVKPRGKTGLNPT